MIRYALRCAAGHASEGWFRSAADFDRQATGGLLSCPVCGVPEVEKAMMAPALNATTQSDRAAPGPTASAPVPMVAPDPRQVAFREMLRAVHKHVAENSDNVGKRFAEEARKIHYDEAKPRSIHGEATVAEARALAEEGIEVHPLPPRPKDAN